jgi:hypothetical protein
VNLVLMVDILNICDLKCKILSVSIYMCIMSILSMYTFFGDTLYTCMASVGIILHLQHLHVKIIISRFNYNCGEVPFSFHNPFCCTN